MYIVERIEATTNKELQRKISELKSEYKEVKVFDRGESYANVLCDEGTPLPKDGDINLSINAFPNEAERTKFIKEKKVNKLWLRDWKKASAEHVWEVLYYESA